MGVVLCEPARVPLPPLLRLAATRWQTVASATICSVNWCRSASGRAGRSRPAGASTPRRELSLDEPGPRDISDLLFVQRELTDALMDHYDRHVPGELECRGAALGDRQHACGRVW